MQLPVEIPLDLAIPVVVSACIAGILYWLWKRYRVRRPKPKPPEDSK